MVRAFLVAQQWDAKQNAHTQWKMVWNFSLSLIFFEASHGFFNLDTSSALHASTLIRFAGRSSAVEEDSPVDPVVLSAGRGAIVLIDMHDGDKLTYIYFLVRSQKLMIPRTAPQGKSV